MVRTGPSMHRTQLFIPPDLHRALKAEAEAAGVTVSELVRSMLKRQLHFSHREKTEKGTRVLLDMASREEGE